MENQDHSQNVLPQDSSSLPTSSGGQVQGLPDSAVQTLVQSLVMTELRRWRERQEQIDAAGDQMVGDIPKIQIPPGPVLHPSQGTTVNQVADYSALMPSTSATSSSSLWDDILQGSGQEAMSDLGQALEAHLALPPPMGVLKEALEKLVKYEHVPRTPPARGDRLDRDLQGLQGRVEAAMHLLIHAADQPDWDTMGLLAAVLRSLWEELHQSRRRRFAGPQAYKLDRRVDEDAPRLLNPEEEKRVREAPRRANKGAGGKPQSAQNTAPRQPVLGKGAGPVSWLRPFGGEVKKPFRQSRAPWKQGAWGEG